MKTTSIVFLIIAAVIIVAGIVTASIADGIAASQGLILTQSGSETYTNTYEYSNLSKISIDVKNTEVNIIGGSDKAYVELINFPIGMHEFSNTNRVLTVKNNIDGSSLSGIASMISGFKGLGGIVNYYNLSSSSKIVNVYLSAENPVSIIECKSVSGDINIKNCDAYSDYNITLDNGNLIIDNLQTKSSVSATVNRGNVGVTGSSIKNLTAQVTTGNLNLDGSIDSIKATVETGDVRYNCYTNLGLINYNLASSLGKVFIDGADFGGYARKIYENIVNLTDISVGTGNITLTSAFEK